MIKSLSRCSRIFLSSSAFSFSYRSHRLEKPTFSMPATIFTKAESRPPSLLTSPPSLECFKAGGKQSSGLSPSTMNGKMWSSLPKAIKVSTSLLTASDLAAFGEQITMRLFVSANAFLTCSSHSGPALNSSLSRKTFRRLSLTSVRPLNDAGK